MDFSPRHYLTRPQKAEVALNALLSLPAVAGESFRSLDTTPISNSPTSGKKEKRKVSRKKKR